MTRPAGGPARRLTTEGILMAAIGLVDADGIAELTMRRLGAALGVEAMALYRYFPSRRELLDALVEQVVMQTATDPELQFSTDDDWTDYLHRLAHGVRQMALTHPRIFPLVATHPTQAPWIRPPIRSLRWVDSFLGGLQDHHFSASASVAVYKQFSTFLLGSLLLEVGSLGLDHPDHASAPPTAPDHDKRIAEQARVVDARTADEVMTHGPDTAEILEGAVARVTTTADEPAVVAAEPDIAAAAAAAGVGDEDSVVADVDVPIVAVVVSTKDLDLSDFPNVSLLAGLLAHDTAIRDFDRQLDALIEGFKQLRQP